MLYASFVSLNVRHIEALLLQHLLKNVQPLVGLCSRRKCKKRKE